MDSNYKIIKLLKAIKIGYFNFTHFFGSNNEYPLSHGTSFGMNCDDGVHYNVTRFNLENLEKLIEREVIDFPIDVALLDNDCIIIVDKRVPIDWYSKITNNDCDLGLHKAINKIYKENNNEQNIS